MKRRFFASMISAAIIVAAAPMFLAGVVNAQGRESGFSTGTGATDLFADADSASAGISSVEIPSGRTSVGNNREVCWDVLNECGFNRIPDECCHACGVTDHSAISANRTPEFVAKGGASSMLCCGSHAPDEMCGLDFWL